MPRQGLWVLLSSALACCCSAISFGGFRLDLTGKDLSPQQYRDYIRARTPEPPRLKVPSPLWYLYREDHDSMQYKAQMAELKYVESQLGVKFWKIRIKSSATENLLRSLWLTALPPSNIVDPIYGRVDPQTPFFYNMFTGEGMAGAAGAKTIKKLALGKPFHRGPFQDFESPQFQDLVNEVHAEEEKRIMMDDSYTEGHWIMRYRKERDAALKAHKRQYARRKWLSKLPFAKPLPPDERHVDVDQDAGMEQAVRMGWVKNNKRMAEKQKKQKKGGDK